MSKKIITVVEDVEEIRNELKESIEHALEFTVEVKAFANNADFEKYQETEEFGKLIRASIFDLANNQKEVDAPGSQFSIKEYIEKNYNTVRVPIIIHSAYLHRYPEFNDSGTVFKIEKTSDSIDKICDLLASMHKTDFLEVFSPGGILERQHPEDLHEVFTSQFKANGKELCEILDLLQNCHKDADKCKERVYAIFQRMALRALVNKLTSRSLDIDESVQVNVLEHFYRRTNTAIVPIWTGDILENKSDGLRVYVLRPKCDLERLNPSTDGEIEVLVCPLKIFDFPVATGDSRNQLDKVSKAAEHNLSYGPSSRAIPPSIFYPKGGKYPKGSAVDFARPKTPKYSELVNDYKYLVTLSDDFVNEIATRFGSYLVRPGIVEIDPREF